MGDKQEETKVIGGEFGEVIMSLMKKEADLDAELDSLKVITGERSVLKRKIQKQIKELSELNGTQEPAGE